MATQPKKTAEEKESRPLFEISRKILLASIGVMALAQDEIEDFVSKLIERGEIAEKDGRKLVREILDKRKEKAREMHEEVGKRVEEALVRLNIPTKSDIEALNNKIAALTRKIDELKKTPPQS